uniref:Uncharacterized protein n=1 Tax=Sym plasmid TaxID=28430 RepID=A0A515HJE7_9ZZZZ|nr:hypothetical protein pTL9_00045 [Sym plasmid]
MMQSSRQSNQRNKYLSSGRARNGVEVGTGCESGPCSSVSPPASNAVGEKLVTSR